MRMKILYGVMLASFTLSLHAKGPNPLCNGSTGCQFPTGNGSKLNPFLICNPQQLSSIGTNPLLLSQNYIMGADISFAGVNFVSIGAENASFSGTFDGNGYKLSDVTLNPNSRDSYLAIFKSIDNSTIKNLLVDKVTLGQQPFSYVGGLIANATNSTISDVKITNLDMQFASKYSGGLIGKANNCTMSNISVQGKMQHFFGTKHSGGLVGNAYNSHISSCVSHVNVNLFSNLSFGISGVGLLVGVSGFNVIDNSYADGSIDYSVSILSALKGRFLGGLVGEAGETTFNSCYYAGILIVPYITNVGGAVGSCPNCTNNGLFWDTELSGIATSSVGTGQTSLTMRQKSFWISQGFNPTIWVLANGSYPKLASEG